MAQRLGTGIERTLGLAIPWVAVTLAGLVIGVEAARSPLLAIALTGLMATVLLVMTRRLPILVAGTVAALAWGTSTLPGATSVGFAVKFAMMAAICATVLPRLVAADRRHLPIPLGFGAAFLGLVLFAVVSILWSVAPDTGQKSISLLLLWGAVVVAIPLWAKDPDDLVRLVRMIAVLSASLVVIGLVASLAGLLNAPNWSDRLQIFLNNPNAIGYWMAPTLPPLVMLAAREQPGLMRRILVLLVAGTTLAILLSGSRAGALASITGVSAGLLVSGARQRSGQARRAIVILAVAVTATAISLSLLDLRLRSSTAVNEGLFSLGTGSGRSTAWVDSIPLIARRPLLGHGFGATQVIFPAFQDNATQRGVILPRTHDSYLEAGVDLGWTGALWLFLLALSGVVAAMRVARRTGPNQTFATVILAGIVGGMVEGLFESGMLAAGGLLAFPFWMLVAMAHVLLAIQTREARTTSRVPARLPTT